MIDTFTLFPEINRLLAELYSGVRAVLGDSFTGMYLDGSLACGAFDFASDVDLVIVTEVDVVLGEVFEALQELHKRLALLDPVWGNKLEGTYISRPGLRHYDPEHVMHPNIEWGEGERLKMTAHDSTWDIHRYILCEHGVRVAGPPPQELIDPVTPDQLRRAAWAIFTGWAAGLLAATGRIQGREYQSYTVLTLCRILYTLQIGDVATKPIAARWCQERLGPPWSTLIERVLEGRQHSDIPLLPGEVQATLDFIRYAVTQLRTYNEPKGG
jgi:predicted nucleotidyltransferase